MRKKTKILSLALVFCLALPASAFGGSSGGNGIWPAENAGSGADSAASEMQVITRGKFISMLAESSGEELQQYIQVCSPFSDVKNEDEAVSWAYAKWLINGGGDGRFRPNDRLNRQEAAAILGRYLDYRYTSLPVGCGTGLPDTAEIAEWARDGVTACCMYGIIPEESAGQSTEQNEISSSNYDFRPMDSVSAADASRWIENVEKLNLSAVTLSENRTFSDRFTETVKNGAEGKNWSVSPYSARAALAMMTAGAQGATQRELLDALQIEDIGQFGDEIQHLMERYDSYSGVIELRTANSAWLNQSWFGGKGEFLPDYRDEITQKYRAEVKDVTDSNSVEEVNAWVDEKTEGKIPEILSEDNRNFVTAFVNAVYFRAAWNKEFSEKNTEQGVFKNADGSQVETDFMNQTDFFGYYSTPGVEAVRLDYRNYGIEDLEGGQKNCPDADFSMYLIKAEDRLSDLENILDQAEFETSKVSISMPKFRVECTAELDAALKSMGVKRAYDSDRADFSGILDPSLLPGTKYFMDTVIQKTYIAVDEEGTEAAAATAAMDGSSSLPPERQPLVREFIADEPFYFVIRDNAEGLILFAGQYNLAGV